MAAKSSDGHQGFPAACKAAPFQSRGSRCAVYGQKPQEGRETPVSRAMRQSDPIWIRPHSSGQREDNAQVEDPYGRGQALQQDWHRQDQAGPDEDAAHPYFKVAKSEAQAGPDPAGFRRRLQEGSAHDSLRLIAALIPKAESALQGPRERVARAPGRPESSALLTTERFRLDKSE